MNSGFKAQCTFQIVAQNQFDATQPKPACPSLFIDMHLGSAHGVHAERARSLQMLLEVRQLKNPENVSDGVLWIKHCKILRPDSKRQCSELKR